MGLVAAAAATARSKEPRCFNLFPVIVPGQHNDDADVEDDDNVDDDGDDDVQDHDDDGDLDEGRGSRFNLFPVIPAGAQCNPLHTMGYDGKKIQCTLCK